MDLKVKIDTIYNLYRTILGREPDSPSLEHLLSSDSFDEDSIRKQMSESKEHQEIIKKINREKEKAEQQKTEYFNLSMPNSKSELIEKGFPTEEKKALYIPHESLKRIKSFESGKYYKNVLISKDILSIIKTILKSGKIGKRYSSKTSEIGLEDDPTKRQVIIYTIVVDSKFENILVYQRASSEDVKKEIVPLLGDERLQGKISIGFGGHTSNVDINKWRIIETLIPGFYNDIMRTISIEQARLREFEEELGITYKNLKDFYLHSGFYVNYSNEEINSFNGNVSVHAVHFCICAVAIIDDNSLSSKGLTFPKKEIATANWVSLSKLAETFDNLRKNENEIELWSEIVQKEIIPQVLIDREIKI